MIPGANLLGLAHQLIGFQKAVHWRNKAIDEGIDGVETPKFHPSKPISGSMQPIPKDAYQYRGLDLNKNFMLFYTSVILQDLTRDKAPDMLDYAAVRYNVQSKTDWQNQDHWCGYILVEIGPAA